ncbi:hypothetical protein E2I00_012705, partial [Balaenoptera physalus]
MSEKRSHEHSYQTPAHLITTELQFPMSYVDRLVWEYQYVHTPSSSTTDFLLAMLDYLTEYILDLVGTEANGGMQITPQDMERAEPHRHLKDTAFAQFD